MPELTVVSRERHAGKAWRHYTSYSFTADDAVLPLAASELVQAVMGMPVAFVQQDGRYVLMAVLSLTPGRNLFVAPDGRWLGEYVPMVLRGYPFRLLRPEAERRASCASTRAAAWWSRPGITRRSSPPRAPLAIR